MSLRIQVLKLSLLACGLTSLASCGKTIAPLDRSAQEAAPLPAAPACAAAQVRQWHYVQPDATVSHAVDLLFVVDTSASLNERRRSLSMAIPEFLSRLPAQTDTRIGVMLAHGPASQWSARLFAPAGTPAVIDVSAVGTTEAARLLELNLGHPVADVDEADGEMMMLSLTRSLETTRFAEIQAQGFYRPNAALSVVFVTDENDICYDPRQHGFTTFPDFKPSGDGSEDVAFARYCTGVSPAATLAALHSVPANVPVASEEAIGHGILELLATDPDGITLDLADDFQVGLTRLASVVSTQLDLLTSFGLPDPHPLVPGSISVKVDGHAVAGAITRGHRVQIPVQDAGAARSLVDITACAQE